MKIKSKFFILNTIFLLIFIFLIYFFYCYQKNKIYNKTLNTLKKDNNVINELIQGSLDVSIKSYLRGIAEKNRDITVKLYNNFKNNIITEQEAKKRLFELFFSQKIADSGYIYIVNSKGDLVYHPSKFFNHKNLKNYDFIKRQINHKNGFIKYKFASYDYQRPENKVLYMAYFKPWDWIISVSAKRNELKSLININDFRNQILALKFGKTGYSYVIDSKGNLIIHPYLQGTNILNAKDEKNHYFIKEVVKNKNGIIKYPWKNKKNKKTSYKLVVYSYIPSMDWIIASGGYFNEFNDELNSFQLLILLIITIYILNIIIINLLLNRIMFRPLKEFLNKIKNINISKKYLPLKIHSKSEIGLLSVEFNRMIIRIKNHTKNLESLVLEKTKDLHRANSNLKKINQQLNEKNNVLFKTATTDKLTGIYNRSYLINAFEKEFAKCKRHNINLSCIMIDIDFFKNVNDTYGHLTGDFVLENTAKNIHDSLRKEDIFGRYGGEEFLVILPNTSIEQAENVAEKIRKNIERTKYSNNNNSLNVTLSLGVSNIFIDNPKNIDNMILNSDIALYESKNSGRNKTTVYTKKEEV
ncbi:sensor domain-containing diguanylate cyclase [Haliovirga abyssi]|uniref:GGDEF domain-containing protein n=1 Tax=Haliovirga abyssi TaxID=2996794 RepID=A0AAU9DSU6_9FUSO|nr:diguanylate cyclase [Haliovirga abyssi]BDU51718.1 hypothetical protein HLVA_22870 [Haliovirga abyssi]